MPSALYPALGKRSFAECLISSTRQNYSFAECQVVALGKHLTPSAPKRAAHGGRACWARAQSLPSAAGPALGKRDMLPSATFCRRPALGNAWVCRVADVCRVLVAWHSANHVFAECPCLSSRQRPRHSAKAETLGKFGFSGSESLDDYICTLMRVQVKKIVSKSQSKLNFILTLCPILRFEHHGVAHLLLCTPFQYRSNKLNPKNLKTHQMMFSNLFCF